MSPSAYITKRSTGKGEPRYVVRYRPGGRETKVVHAGSFTSLKEAKARRDFVAGELARGRDPREALRLLVESPATRKLADVYESWKAGRLDLAERTLVNIALHWKRLAPTFAAMAPEAVELTHVQDWVTKTATGDDALSPAALRDYLSTLRQVLDFARVQPNPARDPLLRLPVRDREVPVPPTDKHVVAMLEHMPRERRLVFAFLEQDGGRIGEHVAFTFGDVDQEGARILARPEAVKGRRGRRKARWLQVPEWLMELLLDQVAPEDRIGDRPLFPWLRAYEHPERAAWRTMEQACKAAGIPHFHPHDLRHRRLSLWHGQGIPAREVADRVGHSKASMSLDVYSHVMPLDEVAVPAYRAVLVRSR